MVIRPRKVSLDRSQLTTMNVIEGLGMPKIRNEMVNWLVAHGLLTEDGKVTDAGEDARRAFYNGQKLE